MASDGRRESRHGETTVIDIGDRKQLFIDRRFIAHGDGVELELHLPHLPEENLLPANKPWESSRAGLWGSIVHDEGLFRLWYEAIDGEWYYSGEGTRHLCYAESEDGIQFDKPDLGLVPFKGSTRNNIVIGDQTAHGHLFLDSRDDPARRYKGLVQLWPSAAAAVRELQSERRHELQQLHLITSPDGIHWDIVKPAVFPMAATITHSVFWDDRLSKWAIYLRTRDVSRGPNVDHGLKFTYARLEVEENRLGEPYPFTPEEGYSLEDYGTPNAPNNNTLVAELPIILEPDKDDAPGAQIYCMNAIKYRWADDVYVAFPAIWDYPDGSDLVEAQLALSRDGVSWERPWRRPIIPPGLPGSGKEGQIFPMSNLFRRGDELWLYYQAEPGRHMHGEMRLKAGLMARAIWRLDGFVSATAGHGEGELVTPPLTFKGDTLTLNADMGAVGRLRVGLEDADGNELRSFSLAESEPLYGADTGHRASWRGGGDVGNLAQPAGESALRDAILPAVRVSVHHQNGLVIATIDERANRSSLNGVQVNGVQSRRVGPLSLEPDAQPNGPAAERCGIAPRP